MSGDLIKALLIEDNPGDARKLREALTVVAPSVFDVELVERLDDGIERLRRAGVDVVLLGLSRPGATAPDTVERLHAEAPRVPIVVLSPLDGANLTRDAVKWGADDCLVKGAFSPEQLERVIRYAIDRAIVREELTQARDSALESARLRAEFLANMSHEIRTPLTGVIGMTRLLMDTRLNPDQREMMGIVRSSADTLIKIVNDVLDFSRISAGKLKLEQTDFDLVVAIKSVMALFTAEVQRKNIQITSAIDANVETRLRGDPLRLSQVLTNLIGNAVKFTPRGEVAVRVSRVSEAGDDLMVRFTVNDTGIGIPLEGQRHLFRAFTQGDDSTTRKYGGTGLGLAISAQLVELMGGSIGVRSEPGGGSSFWFTAALRKQPAAASTHIQASARIPGIPPPAAEPEAALQHTDADEFGSRVPAEVRARTRLLMVEDNAVNQQVYIRMLERMGYRPESANNGRAVLAALDCGKLYDVILMDCQMPEIDGYTATRAVRQREVAAGHRTTIIGITAHAMADDRDECIAAGMDDYLAKPVMPEELAAALDKWVLTMHGAGAVAQFQAAGASPAVSAAETPVLDWRTLAELRECQRLGESDFVQRLIDVFLSDLARQIRAIRNSIEAGAAERVSQAAHALKGACAELGAREMQALCEWLESHAHQGLPDGTQEIIEHFDREAERLRQALTTERTRLSE